MSKAVIDFCDRLEATLLSIEERLAGARRSLEEGREQMVGEARKHLDEAAEELNSFKAKAGEMAAELRADLPKQAATIREKLSEFGQEAQVAMRHAVVVLAESASKSARGVASALEQGAQRAHGYAEALRRETAVARPEDAAGG
jgi:molybdopterin converting factor small subunit